MSEIQRFNNLGRPCLNGCFVGSSDYDAAQSELATLREELATTKGELDSLLVRYSNMWDAHDKCAQRLTDAEQRNALMSGFLVRMHKGDCNDLLAAWQSEMEMVLVDAAIKPTESGASE